MNKFKEAIALSTLLKLVITATTSIAPDKAPLKVKQLYTYDRSRATLQQFVAQIEFYIKFNYNRLFTGNDKVFIIFSYLGERAFN